MGRLKDQYFDQIFDGFVKAGIHQIEQFHRNNGCENFSEEVFEVNKGNTKTMIKYRFDNEGNVVSHSYESYKYSSGGNILTERIGSQQIESK